MIHLIAVLGALCLSFSPIFARLAETQPSANAFFRTFYALPVLAVVHLFFRDRDQRPASARGLAVAAGAFLGLDLVTWNTAMDKIGAALATLLANTQVIFVGLAAWVIYREKPHVRTFATVPVVLLGVGLVSGLGRNDSYGSDPLGGIGLGIFTAMAYSCFILGIRAANRGHLAPAVGPLLDATAGAAVASLLIGLASGRFEIPDSLGSHGWLLAQALAAQVVGWLLISHALPRLAGLEVALILLIQPALAVVWARLILDERLSWVQLTGVAVVLAGVTYLGVRGSVAAGREPFPEPG